MNKMLSFINHGENENKNSNEVLVCSDQTDQKIINDSEHVEKWAAGKSLCGKTTAAIMENGDCSQH